MATSPLAGKLPPKDLLIDVAQLERDYYEKTPNLSNPAQKVAFGTPKAEFEHAHIHDVSTFEWGAWVPILVLIVILGIFPNIVFHVTDGAVTHLTSAIANVIK